MLSLGWIIAALAVVLAGVSAVLFVQAVGDIAASPVMRIRTRTRSLADEGISDIPVSGGSGILIKSAEYSSSGWPNRVCMTLLPMVTMLDKAGVKADKVRLRQSGLGRVLTVDDMVRVRAWIAFVAGVGMLVLGLMSGFTQGVFFGLLGLGLGVRIPSFLIASAATTRVKECVRALPEMIDMVALGSRAGMTFDNALGMYSERFDTPLSHEFGRALEKWRVGADTREGALNEVGVALDVEIVSRFISSVLQAIKLGSPLAKVLEEQSIDARKEQKMVLESEIAKAPVKMFVPLGTLILPAMLILLLGPVMLQIASSFAGVK